jgi:hypothetical protein
MNTNLATHHARVRIEAMRAFRQRKLRRSILKNGSIFVAVVGVVASAALWPPQISNAPLEGILALRSRSEANGQPEAGTFRPGQAPAQTAADITEPSTGNSKVEILSDDELLALFPRGSCYLAEVNGQKRLIFRDPDLKKLYFN